MPKDFILSLLLKLSKGLFIVEQNNYNLTFIRDLNGNNIKVAPSVKKDVYFVLFIYHYLRGPIIT